MPIWFHHRNNDTVVSDAKHNLSCASNQVVLSCALNPNHLAPQEKKQKKSIGVVGMNRSRIVIEH